MLTPRHLATIRAALLYWQEEMCPHGSEVMQPYFEMEQREPLSREEIAQLRAGLEQSLRYAVYDGTLNQLASAELFLNYATAKIAAGGLGVAIVVIPDASLQEI